MVSKIIFLGVGAAPGVPCLSIGWGDCNPNEPKNRRMRTSTYLEIGGAKILIDTSPDLRMQLIDNNIRDLDAVLYTHMHADHLHGIDELREVNRITGRAIELYASANNLVIVKTRFPYLIAEDVTNIEPTYRAALHPNSFEYNKPFYIKGVKVVPVMLSGHNVECAGYIFNDGEVVYIADCKEVPEEALKLIVKQPEIMVMPLTTPKGTRFHASFEDLCEYNDKVQPKKMIINHMAAESDYGTVYANCLSGMEPGYDGMVVEW